MVKLLPKPYSNCYQKKFTMKPCPTPYFCVLEYVRSNPSSYILSSREEYDRVPTFHAYVWHRSWVCAAHAHGYYHSLVGAHVWYHSLVGAHAHVYRCSLGDARFHRTFCYTRVLEDHTLNAQTPVLAL